MQLYLSVRKVVFSVIVIIVIDLLPKTCGVWKCLFLGGQHKKCKTFSETDTLCSPGSKGSGNGELQSELLIGGSAL